MEKRLVTQTPSSLLNFGMLFRLGFAIIKAVITVKPYLVYSHIWLNIKIIIATLVTNKNS